MKPEKDPNYVTYQSLLKSEEWFNEYKGKFVVFVDGKLVDYDHNKNELLDRVGEKYGGTKRFFTKVDRDEGVIDIPTPLEIIVK